MALPEKKNLFIRTLLAGTTLASSTVFICQRLDKAQNCDPYPATQFGNTKLLLQQINYDPRPDVIVMTPTKGNIIPNVEEGKVYVHNQILAEIVNGKLVAHQICHI